MGQLLASTAARLVTSVKVNPDNALTGIAFGAANSERITRDRTTRTLALAFVQIRLMVIR